MRAIIETYFFRKECIMDFKEYENGVCIVLIFNPKILEYEVIEIFLN
ncbi:MAG: hypothetical protein KatS3mg096_644 [Candidatus Parcubacteria bacterium]|nr:MAG: hypothetical protein KatS3mg096_644 [Candidatus Parcubacteria bacterium]